MKLDSIEVSNFRLLEEVKLSLEEITTVIVGRNNSGKTSLTEVFYKLFSERSKLSLEDFTLSHCEDFWNAYKMKQTGDSEADVRSKLPVIKVTLNFLYDKASSQLGYMSNFIIDLDETSNKVKVEVLYSLMDGKLSSILAEPLKETGSEPEKRSAFLKELKDRIKPNYSTTVEAVDPTDVSNRKKLDINDLKTLLMVDFINAQRPLDNDKSRESNTLSRLLEPIFSAKGSEQASATDKGLVNDLNLAVSGVQDTIDSGFKDALEKLLPSLNEFGYPGLSDSILKTETLLDVEKLLKEHTSLFYEGLEGINLPESQNGLGTRNLIYILFKLYQAFKAYQVMPTAPAVQLIFIEEPEAHLHPQMQEVFIKQINEIKQLFIDQYNNGNPWDVQFIVTTHSSHVANKADFRAIRYFLTTRAGGAKTEIKDLRLGLKTAKLGDDEKFLHKYLELTRCDLFFADKAVLIEGQTERILLPRIISESTNGLKKQYVSVVEVGGAHAHIFFDFLNFLQLKTLIITDIDTGTGAHSAKSKVVDGTSTSNSCINKWFAEPEAELEAEAEVEVEVEVEEADEDAENGGLTGSVLVAKTNEEKTHGLLRIAYQVPESGADPAVTGRSFEESFIRANPTLFVGVDAWDKAEKIASARQKTDFALRYAIMEDSWITPRYILEGLDWLALNVGSPAEIIQQVEL